MIAKRSIVAVAVAAASKLTDTVRFILVHENNGFTFINLMMARLKFVVPWYSG